MIDEKLNVSRLSNRVVARNEDRMPATTILPTQSEIAIDESKMMP